MTPFEAGDVGRDDLGAADGDNAVGDLDLELAPAERLDAGARSGDGVSGHDLAAHDVQLQHIGQLAGGVGRKRLEGGGIDLAERIVGRCEHREGARAAQGLGETGLADQIDQGREVGVRRTRRRRWFRSTLRRFRHRRLR